MGDSASAITYFEESVEFLSQSPSEDMEVRYHVTLYGRLKFDCIYYDK